MSEHEYKEMVERKTKSEMEKASGEYLKWSQEYFLVFHEAYIGEEK